MTAAGDAVIGADVIVTLSFSGAVSFVGAGVVAPAGTRVARPMSSYSP